MTASTASLTDVVGVADTLQFNQNPIPIELYSTAKPNEVGDPSFSPDGTTVVFTEKVGSSYHICTVSVGATSVHSVLLSGSNKYGDPSYSADGLYILFTEQTGAVSGPHPYGQWALKYMGAAGDNVVTILSDGNANIHPCWVTPTQIAFQNWQYGATPSSAFQISLIDLAGNGRMDIGEGEYPRTVVI